MESFAGNGSTNYYNGHPGPYSMQYSSPLIKFESEPYHAVEGDSSQGYSEFSGTTGAYPTNTFQQPYDQEFGTQQSQSQPFYSTSSQPNTDTQPVDNGLAAPSTPAVKTSQTTPTGGSVMCDICSKVFSSNPSMRRHREIHSGQKKFSCELCGNSYTQKHNLTKHMRLHTGEKPYSCTLCDKAFYIHHHLKNHMIQHTSLYPHNCEICKQGFKHRNKLEAHMKKHDQQQPLEDGVMSPKSGLVSEDNSTSELWADGKVEDEEEEAMDEENGEKGEEIDEDTNDGLYNSFDEEEKTYDEHECEVCQQIFISKESLDKHMQLHSVDKEFKCEECSNIFLTRAHLVRHRKVHTGETIYNCEECNVSFRWKVSLHIHMRRHNNDYKRHECPMCNKYFLARTSLKKHMSTHVNEPSFDCEECGEKFSHMSEYKSHVQSEHTSEETPRVVVGKPTCKTCHKTFSSNSSLRKHEYTHLDIKPHKCELCNVSFAQKIQLRLHNKKHNGVIDPPMTPSERKEAVKQANARRDSKKKEKNQDDDDDDDDDDRVNAKKRAAERRNARYRARNGTQEDENGSEESEETEVEDNEDAEEEEASEAEVKEEDNEDSHSEESEDSDDDSDDEEDDDDEDESQEEQMDTNQKKSRWEGYRYPVCGYCKLTFKKKNSLKRHIKSCRKKHKA